jgi:DNA gyrase/topoisomerase IV subunit A
VRIIRFSRDIEDAANKLMDALNLDEIGAKYVVNQRLSILTGIRPEQQKDNIALSEKRLSNVKELAKYDK